ncbi:MAG: hypothetical protein CK425_10085 [Parachlamydia sp.]|nr:MAG: hypothetical protein CK425_10085 [Parachlamydia sp.]
MEDSIKTKIKEIENTHGIRTLFACESGSRAWGFPSPDSDYDVRFIYIRPREWYLSIQEKPDVLELAVNKLLDINGWDLKKALKLLAKHNAVLYEWMQSPIIYAENPLFKTRFIELSNTCFSQIAAMHHYLSCAKKYYEVCIEAEMVKLKMYFYCLRSTLAAFWIYHYQTVPPMELQKLLYVINDKPRLLDKILTLVQIKSLQNESYVHPRQPELDHFFYEAITLCESAAPSLSSAQSDYEVFNTFFQEMIIGEKDEFARP